MSMPTFAQLAVQLSNATALAEKLRRAVLVQADNVNTHQDALEQSYHGDYTAELAAGVGGYRSLVTQALDGEPVRRLLDPVILGLGKLANLPFASVETLLPELRRWFVANSHAIKNPSPTLATPVPGSGVNGSLYRLNVDEDGHTLLTQWFDVKAVECVIDESTGALPHESVLAIRSSAAGRDRGFEIGAGVVTPLTALSARHSLAYVANPSFSAVQPDSPDGAILTADPDGWTHESGGGFATLRTYTSDYYRDFQGDVTPRSLELTADTSYYQVLNTLDSTVPYYVQFAVKRRNSADGALTVSLQPFAGGGTSVNVTVSALANDQWYVFQLPLNASLWHRNFSGIRPVIRWALSGRTTGEVRIDDFVISPWTRHDGGWYVAVDSRPVGTPGAPDPFTIGDTFTIADSVGATAAIVWRWLHRAYGVLGQLPSHPTVFDVPEPTVT